MRPSSSVRLVSQALISPVRNHWTHFPVAFNDRSLPLVVYDELKAILIYGLLGGFSCQQRDLMIELNYMPQIRCPQLIRLIHTTTIHCRR